MDGRVFQGQSLVPKVAPKMVAGAWTLVRRSGYRYEDFGSVDRAAGRDVPGRPALRDFRKFQFQVAVPRRCRSAVES